MKQLLFILVALSITMIAYGQEKSIKIKTTNASKVNYYTDITYLNAGDVDDNGKFYRLIIFTSEIYDTIVIEGLTVGEEGGNVKLVSKRMIDMREFASAFHINGEVSGINFLSWESKTSFAVKLFNKKYLFKNIGSPSIVVSELQVSEVIDLTYKLKAPHLF